MSRLHRRPNNEPPQTAVAEAERRWHRQAATADATVFDMDDAMSKCGRNYSIVQEMIGCFFDEADTLIEKMRVAVDTGNATALGNAAHRLKGTVLYLGARAADATQRVEQIGKSGELAGAVEALQQLEEQIRVLKDALLPHRRS